MGIESFTIERIENTDVLVVGGGGAAVRAAVAAFDAGARTTVVLKGQKGRSGATVSPDSSSLAWQVADNCSSSEDSPEVHYRNIVEVGLGMADPRLARILAYEIEARTRELEEWGLEFVPDPTGKHRHYAGFSCFGDQPRAHCLLNTGYGHGGDLVRVLVEQIKLRRIDVHENTFISDLLVQDGSCVGALGIGPDGEVIVYRAGAVILASGGARQIFPPEPGRTQIDTTGDGYAMAFRAGARLTNMEFTQFMLHPVAPFPVKAPGVFWALNPKLKNRHGDDALAPYLPVGVSQEQVMLDRTLHYPFSSRDTSKWLDIAFANEIREGRGTAERGLFLDFSEVDLHGFRPSRPQHVPEDYSGPVVLPDHLVQVRPAAHAINGGLYVGENGESNVPGLFAIGEAATGSHGADRLGGGMVSGSQVFGARAGKSAAEYARGVSSTRLSPETTEEPLVRLRRYGKGTQEAGSVFLALQEVTGTHLVVLRNERGLKTLLSRIEELIVEWLPNVAVKDAAMLRRAIEAENSLLTARLMAEAALLRKESRGGHYREDIPLQQDDVWRKNIIFRNRDGKPQADTISLETGIGG